MGQAKQQWIEDESQGYSIPDANEKFVCADHFDDCYLKQYVLKKSSHGKCTYCNKTTNVIDLSIFFEYIADKVTHSFSNPDNENMALASHYYDDDNETISGFQRVGCYVAPDDVLIYESTEELLYDLELTDDGKLLKEISDCFLYTDWISCNPYIMTKDQELSYMWKQFENQIKYTQRFTFFNKLRFIDEESFSENGLQDIFSELNNIITTHRIIRTINRGTRIYRCRFLNDDEKLTTFDEITSAPAESAKQSRMSPAGISMFYGAFDKDIARKESSQDSTGEGFCAIGEFETKKDLRILDLTTLPKSSFWGTQDYRELEFLHSFRRIISKSIKRDDKIHIEYVPSQVFTEHIRYSYGQQIDGIIYDSSLVTDGKNIVLFYDKKNSREILNLLNMI